MKTTTALLAALALAAAAPLAAQQPADSARMALGRTYARWFQEGRTDTLWALFTPQMRAAVPTAQGLAGLRQSVAQGAGAEGEVVSETAREVGQGVLYERVSRYATSPVPLRLTIATTAGGQIAGFGIRPATTGEAAPTRFADYVTQTALRLPFDGEWYVFWGGRSASRTTT